MEISKYRDIKVLAYLFVIVHHTQGCIMMKKLVSPSCKTNSEHLYNYLGDIKLYTCTRKHVDTEENILWCNFIHLH